MTNKAVTSVFSTLNAVQLDGKTNKELAPLQAAFSRAMKFEERRKRNAYLIAKSLDWKR